LLGVLSSITVAAAQRVGVGDSRIGYDTTTYETDSRVLVEAGVGRSLTAKDLETPPMGLPALPVPASNPVTDAKIDLGRRLFFDRRLSFNGTLSCAMCHVPEQGFAQNELKTPVGTEGRFVKRNAPSLYNVGYRRVLFHDGRETSLENQIWAPLLAFNEMANPSISAVLARLQADPSYVQAFNDAFPRGLTIETLGMAIASYERLLVSGGSAFDRWHYGTDKTALTTAQRHGFALFQASGCTSCHLVMSDQAPFTDDAFHDTGTSYANAMAGRPATRRVLIAPGVEITVDAEFERPPRNDLGRYEATGHAEDRWKVRTPTLRNVAVTAPYMHDGSLATLADVVEFYDRGGVPHEGLDPRIRPLQLSPADKVALVDFLGTLTGDNIEHLAIDARSAPIGDVD
jgi:cytochrome c peroxidase